MTNCVLLVRHTNEPKEKEDFVGKRLVDVWVITPNGILTGVISARVLPRIANGTLPPGSEIQMTIDEKYGIPEGAVIPVRDILARVV